MRAGTELGRLGFGSVLEVFGRPRTTSGATESLNQEQKWAVWGVIGLRSRGFGQNHRPRDVPEVDPACASQGGLARKAYA